MTWSFYQKSLSKVKHHRQFLYVYVECSTRCLLLIMFYADRVVFRVYNFICSCLWFVYSHLMIIQIYRAMGFSKWLFLLHENSNSKASSTESINSKPTKQVKRWSKTLFNKFVFCYLNVFRQLPLSYQLRSVFLVRLFSFIYDFCGVFTT